MPRDAAPAAAGSTTRAVRQVQRALLHLADPWRLLDHPFATAVHRELGPAARSEQVVRTLQQQLRAAVEALRPAAGTDEQARSWRPYRLLVLRYVEGLDHQAVQRRLGLGHSQYFTEHAAALRAVATHLAEAMSPTETFSPEGAAAGRTAAGGDVARAEAAAAPPLTPLPLASFIGRARELAAITEYLLGRAGLRARLLTLVGPPGAGKTRLALEAAARVRTALRAVYLVDLAPIEEPSLLLQAIAEALRLPDAGEGPLDARLCRALGDQSVLLLLDNFEHLLAAAPALAAFLHACPGVQALATSQAPLGIYGEQRFPVAPLALPPDGAAATPEHLASFEAVQLFAERARAVCPDFRLDADNAAAVAAICRRLDGLPLALELAAARSTLFSPRALLARLPRWEAAGDGDAAPLHMLTGGAPDLPARHQTLRATIGWSYDLLAPPEQALLRRLAVFVGPWSEAEAAAVAAVAPPVSTTSHDLLERLTSLHRRSLLHAEEQHDGALRFSLLETIRDFALEALAASGEAEAVGGVHAAYFLTAAEEAARNLQGATQAASLRRLEGAHGNLRAALAWHERRGDAPRALRLGAALGRFWLQRGYAAEGLERLGKLLALPLPDDAAARAEALRARGVVLQHAASLAMYEGDQEAARANLEEALALAEAQRDAPRVAEVLNALGLIAREQGDYQAARCSFERSLAISRERGDRNGAATALDRLGTVAHALGDRAAAQAHYDESQAIWQALGQRALLAWSLHNAAYLALDGGDAMAARVGLLDSLAIREELGDRPGLVRSVAAIAALAALAHQPAPAYRLAGAAAALEHRVGVRLSRMERDTLARALATLGASRADSAERDPWAEGQTSTLEEAVAEARATAAALELPPARRAGD